MSKKILVLTGPNLNLLGTREPEIYGSDTLADLESLCIKTGLSLGLEVECKQSNYEGELVTWIQEVRNTHAGIIINAGAYTHTSVAILDALKMCECPIYEVHISNIAAREEFRRHSYISSVAKATLCGMGINSYAYALQDLGNLLR